jgi:REP element-mobilizing transposase RayT
MPRKPRIEYSGAFYHIITRGNQKQKIFKDIQDHKKYLQLLASYKQRRHFHLYAYVLMSNHLHLLIETQDVPLSKVIQGINQSYTLHFNRKYRTVGHLFQGRYKAILCDRERYLLALLKYIHHNPVRAKITETPSRYRWSSDRAYRSGSDRDGLVDTDTVLRLFSESRTRSRQKYREYMDDGVTVKKQEVYATVDQRLLGDDTFVERIAGEHGKVRKERRKREHSLDQLAGAVAAAAELEIQELRGASRQREIAGGRVAFTALAKAYGYRVMEIAAYLGRDPTAVSQYARKIEEARELIAAADKALGVKGE